MNLQQLEYIVAIDETRHFARAAEKCFITQPTLSMMVQKLEEELQIKIFDRTRQPVVPTSEGLEIIARARVILAEVLHLKQYACELISTVCGQVRIGIIPTLAPYILPLLVKELSERYPDLAITVVEMVTDQIVSELKNGTLDMALLATPLLDNQLLEYKLFDEEFYAYVSKEEKLSKDKYLYANQIDSHKFWLLKEGHCFRNQVLNICKIQEKEAVATSLRYEAGSIETLINLVDQYQGMTIIPRLAVEGLSPLQKKNIRELAPPRPVREISLVTLHSYPRIKLVEAIKKTLCNYLSPANAKGETQVISIKK
jgi:LysR family transcriptional regulator, hydrogen peroxide-inducible genes activator